MGVGDPVEAAYTLKGAIAQGKWRLVGDSIVLRPVDARFEVLWRRAGVDSSIVSWEHHFEPDSAGGAVAWQDSAAGAAVPTRSGDQLVLRMTAIQGDPGPAYMPNSDGSFTRGRIPSITLP